jgi:hypothetical protein
MTHKKASELVVGDWFIDPCREGRRPAKVVELIDRGDADQHGNKWTDD